jgi:hypothetical protein
MSEVPPTTAAPVADAQPHPVVTALKLFVPPTGWS